MLYSSETVQGITFTRTNADVNGNPRYVVHFTDVLPDNYRETLPDIRARYQYAVKLSHRWGGSKYRGRDFGGGIVVQSYSLQETAAEINGVKAEEAAR